MDKFLQECKSFNQEKFLAGFYSLSCAKNIDFDSKILNTPSKVLGIRVPVLRKVAKALSEQVPQVLDCDIWQNCYELQTLQGLLIAKIKNPEKCLEYLQNYVTKIDNWASCDLTAGDLKIIAKNLDLFRDFICECLHSEQEFVCRFGIILLMKYYLNEQEIDNTLRIIDNINSKFYYVNMALAWLICESFLKDKSKTLKYLKNAKISNFAINKGIQKIRESFRVNQIDKDEILHYKRIGE